MTKHTFTLAPSPRSKCRGCGQAIALHDLRFGERMPNPFGDADMTHWHHPACAAHRRPEALIEALDELEYPQDDADQLRGWAHNAIQHHRLQRLGSLQQSPSGRARCRSCKALIELGVWRIPLLFFEEGSYNASGFIHVSCVVEYCETGNVVPTIERFALNLDEGQLAQIMREY